MMITVKSHIYMIEFMLLKCLLKTCILKKCAIAQLYQGNASNATRSYRWYFQYFIAWNIWIGMTCGTFKKLNLTGQKIGSFGRRSEDY
uniref:Uncharacterized protein n=2 Tax=Anguilla anguilla TaxID=7936 RepID=A0A0E9SI96_ANGAN